MAIAIGNLGALLQELGRHDEAKSHHERALVLLRSVGDPRSEALCLARLAGALAALGDAAGARARLEEAHAVAATLDPLTRATVGLADAFLEVTGDDAGLERARARMAKARAPIDAEGAGPAPADVSDDARALLRILEGLIAARGRPGDVAGAHLEVGLSSDGRTLRTPDGKLHNLQRRRALRLILLALAERHAHAPSRGLSVDDVLEAGWPGERMHAESGMNRVYVAVATLRQLGLKDVIVREEDGYRFVPDARVGAL
ncbi:MAG: tetratricopeptide repeat protein [Myxococcota bacterium]